MDKIIKIETNLNCSVKEAFAYFTENSKLEQWLTAKANVEPIEGGRYELFWRPDDPENDSTLGCRILAIEAPEYLNFEWKGPVQFKTFMNHVQPLTNVTVLFHAQDKGTRVTLLHTGWRTGEEWNDAYTYFSGAWTGAFAHLQQLIKP